MRRLLSRSRIYLSINTHQIVLHAIFIIKKLAPFKPLYGQALIKVMPDLDLEQDADILLLLASNGEVQTQKEICETLQFDKSRLAILIEGLKRKGMIIRKEILPTDGNILYF